MWSGRPARNWEGEMRSSPRARQYANADEVYVTAHARARARTHTKNTALTLTLPENPNLCHTPT